MPRPPTDAAPRVLIVHNRYQHRGGEDAVVEREASALAGAGCPVEISLADNARIKGAWRQLRTAFESAHAPRGVADVLDAVRAFRPDVVHVHNSFPLISPAVHGAVRAAGAATVQTLHNFRVICAGAMLLRDDKPCEDCLEGSPYQAVLHGCYRGSRLGSLAVARMIDIHRRSGTWVRDVDAFIALTEFARERFVRAGLPAARIAVRPNGLPDPGPPREGPRRRLLYVGRLSPEKGLATLAAAAARMCDHTQEPIEVAGDGPMAARLATAPGLTLRGAVAPDAVRAMMGEAAALVLPSLWYEGLPMVLVEAFAAGTPVVASRLGALADLVVHGVTGLHVTPGDPDDLARAMSRILDDPAAARRMGRSARAVYEARWAERVTTDSLLAIYRQALDARRSASTRTLSPA